MDKKEANIDLLFRNGLKDYEILPPSDVWNRISPIIRKQQRPYILLRAAATVAVLVTLSLLTFTWNDEASRIISSAAVQEETIETAATANPEPLFIADAGTARGNREARQVFVAGNEETAAREAEPTGQSSGNTPEYQLISALPSGSNLAAGRHGMTTLSQPFAISIQAEEYSAPLYFDLRENDRSEQKERWTIAALVSPTYMPGFGASAGDDALQFRSVEQPLISYAGGIALAYKVGRRLSVQSGLYFSSFGNELSGITSFAGYREFDRVKGNTNFKVQTSNGVVSVNNPDVYLLDNLSDARLRTLFDNGSFDPVKASLEYLDNSLHQNMSYIELPFVLRYKLIDRTVEFNIVGGLSSNLLVNNAVYASVDGRKLQIAETEDLRMFMLSSSLGMGLGYNIGKNVSFNLEPTIRYFLNPFTGAEGINMHPYSIGIFSGISYRF